jgi:hypothetical protein
MREIYVYTTTDDNDAIQNKADLEVRGYQVTVYGKAKRLTIETNKLNHGSMAGGENGWVLVGVIE